MGMEKISSFSEEQLQEIENKYKEGISMEEISKIFSMCRITLRKLLRDRGVRDVKSHIIPKEQYDEIGEFYLESGGTLEDLSKKFNVNSGTLKKELLKRGIYKGRKSFLEGPEYEEWEKLYVGGMSMREISTKFDVSLILLRNTLKKNGVHQGYREFIFTDEQWSEVLQLCEQRKSYKEIAEKIGVSHDVVRKKLKKKGIKKPHSDIKKEWKIFSEEQYLEMEKQYQEVKNIWIVGPRFGICAETLRKILKSRGVYTSKKLRFTDEEIQFMVDTYVGGKTLEEVGNMFGMSAEACRKILKDTDAEMRRAGWAKLDHTNIPKHEVEEICRLYKEKVPLMEVASITQHSSNGCRRVLEGCGIEVRDNAREYTVDEHYFDVIDTEDKAYWLGFLGADGCVLGDLLSTKLNLQIRDVKHVEKFRDCLGSNHPIKEYDSVCSLSVKNKGKVHRQARISIYSKILASRLNDLGVTPGKSFTVKPCTDIPENLMRHFWRGAVDGDGWLCVGTNKSTGLCGSRFMTYGYLDFIKKSGVETKANVRPQFNIFYISFGGRLLTKKVLDLLYKDATMYLDRKMENYRKLCSEFGD